MASSATVTLSAVTAKQVDTNAGAGCRDLAIRNNDASITVYVGGDTTATSSDWQLLAGTAMFMTLGSDEHVFLLAASGTPSVTVWQSARDKC